MDVVKMKSLMRRGVLLGLAGCLLSSCGTLRYYQHPKALSSTEGLRNLHLKVGQSVKLLRHSSGLIWGGYIHGVDVEDSTLIDVRYGKGGKGDSFDPLVELVGLKPGSCRVVYSNRLGADFDFEDEGELSRAKGRVFTIYVE